MTNMRNYPKTMLEQAHDACYCNEEAMAASELAGCFYCRAVFAPSQVKEHVGMRDRAICPKCGIDATLGSVSGYPLTGEFLCAMREYWFGERTSSYSTRRTSR